ncbi:MAG: hypothetical protein Q7S45_00810 [Candidatus Curtissbacteria bacterium]|nr:hypothetical protein [Candidatus Curtissbacteria bacterium]
MFFVIVGVVILFASFIIALFSLVREQDEREESYLVPISQDTPESEAAEQEVLLAGEPVLAGSENQDAEQDDAEAVIGSVGPFPWEVGGYDDLGSTESSPEEIINEVAGGGQGREILSGEISVRDLRRKMD